VILSKYERSERINNFVLIFVFNKILNAMEIGLNPFMERESQLLINDILIISVILIITWILARISRIAADKIIRDKHVAYRLRQFIPRVIWLLGIIFAISQVSKSIEILLLVAALFGLSIIVGLRDILANILVRPFLDLYSPYRLGDYISVGEFSGKIIDINPINTVILNEDDEVIIIPNSLFVREIFINKSKRAKSEVSLPIILEEKIDTIEFEKKILELVDSMSDKIKKRPKPIIATTGIDENTEELTLIFTLKNPEDKGVVVSKLNDEIRKIIDELKERKKREEDSYESSV